MFKFFRNLFRRKVKHVGVHDIHAIDFYKADHRSQYPDNTELVYSNFTPRSARLAQSVVLKDFGFRVVLLGLQSYMQRVLIDSWNSSFFHQPIEDVIAKYKKRLDTSLGEGAVGMQHIRDLHKLGYLPLKILSLPEGSRVNVGVPMFTVENTDSRFFWLTNYIESDISCEIWKPCTTATIAYEYRRLLNEFAMKTVGNTDFVPLQAHDFSYRGMSCREDASRTGAGHLSSFIGTDSIPAIDHIEELYNPSEVVGVSVPATEHSVMCMGTKGGERETISRLISKIYPSGIVSIVSDTWNFWKVITETAHELRDEILNRTPNELGLAKVVFRPDSGNPVDIICGLAVPTYDNYDDAQEKLDKIDWFDGMIVKVDNTWHRITHAKETVEGKTRAIVVYHDYVPSPAEKGAIECLWDEFGGTVSEQGYKVLNERVGLIYGDSITIERAQAIMKRLEQKKFASTNVVLGIGSYTYQYLTRDTFGFAMKATYGVVDGVPREIFKDPITDSGDKKSAKGLLKVVKSDKGYKLLDQQTPQTALPKGQSDDNLFEKVFENGKILVSHNWEDIKDRIARD